MYGAILHSHVSNQWTSCMKPGQHGLTKSCNFIFYLTTKMNTFSFKKLPTFLFFQPSICYWSSGQQIWTNLLNL